MRFSEPSFTPSEYILLNGEKFSPEDSGVDGIQLLCSDHFVNGPALAALLLTTAVLANEAEGGLALEIFRKKKLFSGEENGLRLNLLSPRPTWSALTLEDTLLNLAAGIQRTGAENTLGSVLLPLFKEQQNDPWRKIISIVEWGLASNNWLIPVEGSAAGAFSTPFICPTRVRDLVLAQSAEPIVDILNECRANRPEIWKSIRAEVKTAFRERNS